MIPTHSEKFLSILKDSNLFIKRNEEVFVRILPLLKRLLPNHLDPLAKLLCTPTQSDNLPIDLYRHLIPQDMLHQLTKHLYGIDISNIEVSQKWLASEKYNQDFKALTREEYNVRVSHLKQKIDTLWNQLTFGSGENQVPKSYLIKNLNPFEIKSKLDIMLQRMIERTAWLGTPPEHDKGRLLAYYSQMVTNFETILEKIKNQPHKEIAAALINIAQVEVEGRCAGAYQAEIEQLKMFLTNEYENMAPEAIFKKQVNTTLSNMNESVVRDFLHSDVHYLNALNFAVKLVHDPDPLISNTRRAYNLLKNALYPEKMINEFVNTSSKIRLEILYDWFVTNTPSDFSGKQQTLEEIKRIKKQESDSLSTAKSELKKLGLSQKTQKDLIELFSSREYIKIIDLKEKWKALGPRLLEELLSQDEEAWKSEIKLQAIVELIKESPGFQQITNANKAKLAIEQKKYIDSIKSDFLSQYKLNKQIQKKIDSDKKNNETFLPKIFHTKQAINNPLSEILRIKKEYDDSIQALGNTLFTQKALSEGELVQGYNRKKEGLPSQRMEAERKREYAEQFFRKPEEGEETNAANQKPWLTHKGALVILKALGVLSEKA